MPTQAAVILAGGSGKRLWPLSRRERPKQLLRLFDNKSLLRKAWDRLTAVFEPSAIWVCAGSAHRELMLSELPEMSAENFIAEPVGRDTANAIGLTAELLRRRVGSDCVMGIFTADHLISPTDRFAEAVRKAYRHVVGHPGTLTCFGISPTHPHTGLGYIHRGSVLESGVHRVQAFREKPDHTTARVYVDSGEYLWNCGMFVWQVETILGELERCLPENMGTIRGLAEQWPSGPGAELSEEAGERFAGLQKISIDYAVMEKAGDVACVEMPCTWLDVGSWPALASVLATDSDGNHVVAQRTVSVDGEGNLLISEDRHLLAVLGMSRTVVVRSADATLICPLEESENLKTLVAEIDRRFPGQYE